MSMFLENQAKQLVVEASNTSGAAISDSNNFSGTGAQWAGVALPLVRKVFGQIAAQEFVSVQPMNLPSGLVFYLDFQYGDAKTPFASAASLYGDTSANFGNEAEGGLYGAGRYSLLIKTLTAYSCYCNCICRFDDVEYDSNTLLLLLMVLSTKCTGSISALDYDALAVRSFYAINQV